MKHNNPFHVLLVTIKSHRLLIYNTWFGAPSSISWHWGIQYDVISPQHKLPGMNWFIGVVKWPNKMSYVALQSHNLIPGWKKQPGLGSEHWGYSKCWTFRISKHVTYPVQGRLKTSLSMKASLSINRLAFIDRPASGLCTGLSYQLAPHNDAEKYKNIWMPISGTSQISVPTSWIWLIKSVVGMFLKISFHVSMNILSISGRFCPSTQYLRNQVLWSQHMASLSFLEHSKFWLWEPVLSACWPVIMERHPSYASATFRHINGHTECCTRRFFFDFSEN